MIPTRTATSRPGPVALALLGALIASSLASSVHADDGVELLRHPYPFRASLSILSDLHGATVEEFEAVHTLINSRDRILPGTPPWQALGLDSLPPNPLWTGGIEGFGFPFADTFFPFFAPFGIFRGFDPATSSLQPQRDKDLSLKFVEWRDKGYIDAIHTFGPGDLSRAQMEAATSWMRSHFSRPVTVHVNHSKSGTPVGVGGPCCTLLNQMGVAARYYALSALGLGSHLAAPKRLPGLLTESGVVALAVSSVAGLYLLTGLASTRRSRWRLAAAAALAAGPLAALQFTFVDFALGDNPKSPYYNLDLLRSLGVRYFWLGESDYHRSVVNRLGMPESRASTGRETIFEVVQFDDGTKGLAFVRSTIDDNAHTLGLLDQTSLEPFVDQGGRSILYLHWLTSARTYFDATGLSRLHRLRESESSGRVWLASASTLLDHAYAYAYVVYDATRGGSHVRIDVHGFDDPIQGRIPARPDQLSHLSFRADGADAVSVRVGQTTLTPDELDVQRDGSALIVTVRPPGDHP